MDIDFVNIHTDLDDHTSALVVLSVSPVGLGGRKGGIEDAFKRALVAELLNPCLRLNGQGWLGSSGYDMTGDM